MNEIEINCFCQHIITVGRQWEPILGYISKRDEKELMH